MGKQIPVLATYEDGFSILLELHKKHPDLVCLDLRRGVIEADRPVMSYRNAAHYISLQPVMDRYHKEFPGEPEWGIENVCVEFDPWLPKREDEEYRLPNAIGGSRVFAESRIWFNDPNSHELACVPMYEETTKLYYELCRIIKKTAVKYRDGNWVLYVCPEAHRLIQLWGEDPDYPWPRWFLSCSCG